LYIQLGDLFITLCGISKEAAKAAAEGDGAARPFPAAGDRWCRNAAGVKLPDLQQKE
jgi:hypothetical protein